MSLCECGCGGEAPIAKNTDHRIGRIKGQPSRFIRGHNHHKHGYVGTKMYGVWQAMKRRCYNPNTKDFRNYGARGIEVCSRWRESFENFLEDMGTCPPGRSLDRINNEGPYEPGNCRWATKSEQNSNRREWR